MAALGIGIIALLVVVLAIVIVGLLVLLKVRVPYVKTPSVVVRFVCEEIAIAPNDVVYDLGAGDGGVLAAIHEESGARVRGFELAPWPFLLAKFRAGFNKGIPRVDFQNFLRVDLSPASVVFCFLAPAAMPMLADKLRRELKPGGRVISYGFQLPGWTPTQTLNPKPTQPSATKLYLYTR